MFCPRLTHNIRLAENAKLQICGHMINLPSFDTINSLKNSNWTSLSVLNVNDFENIKKFSIDFDILMSYGLIHIPPALSV